MNIEDGVQVRGITDDELKLYINEEKTAYIGGNITMINLDTLKKEINDIIQTDLEGKKKCIVCHVKRERKFFIKLMKKKNEEKELKICERCRDVDKKRYYKKKKELENTL